MCRILATLSTPTLMRAILESGLRPQFHGRQKRYRLRILIEGKSYDDYLAKCHEAFRTGLRALFDTRCFGRGYPRYWPFFRSYDQILKHVFGEEQPDVLLADSYFPHDAKGFKYIGFDRVPCGKGFILGDYWDVTGDNRQQFIDY